MGESIQWSLEDLFTGLKVNMRSLPAETALNLASESDYDLFLIYWTPDYQDPYSTLKMMYSGNNRHYSNPFMTAYWMMPALPMLLMRTSDGKR